jgi:hypothetical protein
MIKTRDLQVVKTLGNLRAKQLGSRERYGGRGRLPGEQKRERMKDLRDWRTRGVEHQVGKGTGCQVIRHAGGKWRGFPLVFHSILTLFNARTEGIFYMGEDF